jgi:hypothetical protein
MSVQLRWQQTVRGMPLRFTADFIEKRSKGVSSPDLKNLCEVGYLRFTEVDVIDT